MLRHLRHGRRLVATARVFARHDALFPLDLLPQTRPLHRLARRLARRDAPGRPGQRLARAFQEAGPSFVKLGQSLSTRVDLLGEEVAADLALLQDRLPPFPGREAVRTIEAELERPLAALFTDFAPEPVAAASIAQVHRAVTTDGRTVAVKVLRPGIERAMERDIAFFLWLAETAERLHPPLRRLRPREAVEIFAETTRRELDLRLEAAAAAEFARNNADQEGFRVPAVDWERTARRVLTLEWVEGLPLTDRRALLEAGFDPRVLMERAARVLFTQIFRDGFFHGDMHPGNMLVDARGDIVALDFGIMGRLDFDTRVQLARMLTGFLQGDYAAVADVFYATGFLVDERHREAFTQACRAIGEPIRGRPLAEISFGRLLGQVLSMAREFEMETQPHLLLLQKTMVTAEGVGRALDPEVNLWALAEPLVADWMRENLGPEAELRRALGEGAEALRRLPALLTRGERVLARLEAEAAAPAAPPWLRSPWPWVLLGIALGLALG